MQTINMIPYTNDHCETKVMAVSYSYPTRHRTDSKDLLDVVIATKLPQKNQNGAHQVSLYPVLLQYPGTLYELAAKVLSLYQYYECTELVIEVNGMGQALADEICLLINEKHNSVSNIRHFFRRKMSIKKSYPREYTELRLTTTVCSRACLWLMKAVLNKEIVQTGPNWEADSIEMDGILYLCAAAYGRVKGYEFT